MRLHPLFFKKVYANWSELEREIGAIVDTTEKGDAFEQFCYFFLSYHKDLYQIEEVWCDKVPGRKIPDDIKLKFRLEKRDYGVDGVSALTGGRVEAWQAKFRTDQSQPTATELSTFWSESEYFHAKRTIANCLRLPLVADKKINHEQTLLDKLLGLDGEFFAALFEFSKDTNVLPKPVKYTPRPHQAAMLADVVAGLQDHDRGKLIAACGTGKTLTALWVTESDELSASRVIVFAPSISLVGQTVREWVRHRNKGFEYLCICSDSSITTDIDNSENGEESDIPLEDLDFAVTTTPDEVVRWLTETSGRRQYIFSTYHSIPVIQEAVKRLKGFKFDLGIFDEAHRTVGREDQFFAKGLLNKNIPIGKRLFMTATERLVNPAVKTYAKKSGVEVFSMDDKKKYGPVLHDFNFGKAIEAGVIADYEVILATVNDDEDLRLIEANKLVSIEEAGEQFTMPADLLFKAGFLVKALEEGEVRKVITFHASRKRAIAFQRASGVAAVGGASKKPLFTYVLGDQNSAERSVRISEFERAEKGALGNVHVLSEGVDIPIVDSVYFVDPKNSLIDIVQGIGRALRKGPDKEKVAKVIVPVIIPESVETLEDVAWDEALGTFHAVIQSMRDQDESLSQEIDSYNEFAVTNGKRGTHIGIGPGHRIRIVSKAIKLPTGVSLADFLKNITLRVATANANPKGSKLGFSHLGKGERKSKYKPVFGLLGDYNPAPYRDSLVMPTVSRFIDGSGRKMRTELAFNNNNVSHTERLGVIRAEEKNVFILTKLGNSLLEGRITFEDLFRNQMMLFNVSGIYSYRVILEMLTELKSLNHVEFLFGPYIMRDSSREELDAAIGRIKQIREKYPNIEIASLSNRDQITSDLNSISPVNIPHDEIWGDRSTPKNKFRYLVNSLSLFEDIIQERQTGEYREPIRIKPGAERLILEYLKVSYPGGAGQGNVYGTWQWFGSVKA